jgi:hypothetical protein
MEVLLYFADEDGRLLVPETRRIEYRDSTVENCRQVLEAVIEGSREGLAPVVSEATRVRALYLLDGGELVVDLSRELELGQPKSASSEALMIYGIVNALTQPALRSPSEKDAGVRRVRFLFEGSPPHESFPAHLDLGQPVGPDHRWILPGEDRFGSA